MKKSTKVFAALAGAALVVAGGSAYTAANTVPTDAGAGYGTSTATGVTVETMTVNPNAGDPEMLQSVVYTVDSDVSNAANWNFILASGADGQAKVIIDSDCAATFANPTTTITCEAAANTEILGIESFNLTATQDGLTP